MERGPVAREMIIKEPLARFGLRRGPQARIPDSPKQLLKITAT